MKLRLNHVFKWKWIEQENNYKKQLTILNDLTFESCGDNIHTIVGHSGSGKTTLLRLLNKLESPDQGTIFLDEQDIAKIPARKLRKEIGMVFQVPALFKGTIEENLLFGPRLANDGSSLPDVQNLLTIVGLQHIESERNIVSLSVGQQQRISFARALANKPKLLLLDEPTSALDPVAANGLLDLVKTIHQEMNIGIIMVTHVMEHARRIADTVCLLVEGSLIEFGQASEFFKSPRTEIAQKFIRGEL